MWSSNSELNRAGAIKRVAARRTATRANDELAGARALLESVEEVARPAADARSKSLDEIRHAERSIRNLPLRRSFVLGSVDIDQLRGLSDALDTWRHWAAGLPVSLEAISDVLEIIGDSAGLDHGEAHALAARLAGWASGHGLGRKPPVLEGRPSIDLDLDL